MRKNQLCWATEGVQLRDAGDSKSALTFGGLDHCGPGDQKFAIEGNIWLLYPTR